MPSPAACWKSWKQLFVRRRLRTEKVILTFSIMPQCDYKVNYDKDPIAINLVAKPNGKTIIMFGLIKFIDSNTIKWEVFPMADKQPNKFSNNSMNTSVILKRSK